jgi:hypothetical protein
MFIIGSVSSVMLLLPLSVKYHVNAEIRTKSPIVNIYFLSFFLRRFGFKYM